MSEEEKISAVGEESSELGRRKIDSFFVLHKRKGLVFIKREIVGVDIGNSHIKVVQMDLRKSKPIVTGFYVEEIPFDKRNRGEITEKYIIENLKKITKKAKLVNSLAVSFISGPSVFVHSCSIPEVPEKEIEDAIKADVAKDLPFPVEEAVLCYNIVNRVTGRKGPEFEIAAVFAQKEEVNKKIWLLEQSGLQAFGITVLPFAYENIFYSNLEEVPENTVIITFGENFTGINFFKNGNFMFTRDVSASGKDINKALSGSVSVNDEKVEVTPEMAEELKRKYGIAADPSEYKSDPIASVLLPRARSVYEKIAGEIKRSLGYFARMARINEIQEVYICGGGANTKGLLPFLKEQLGLDIKFFPFEQYFLLSPVIKQKIKGNEHYLNFILPACGLALESKNAKINLVPVAIRTISKIASFKSVYNMTIAAFYIIGIALFLHVKRTTNYFEASLEDLNKNYADISKQNQQVEKFKAYKAKVNRKRKVLDILIGRKPLWHGVLKEISRITPKNVYLQDISFKYDDETQNIEVEISGEIIRQLQSVDYTVSKFSLDMKNSPFFTEVNLENTRTRGRKTLFKIKAFLVY